MEKKLETKPAGLGFVCAGVCGDGVECRRSCWRCHWRRVCGGSGGAAVVVVMWWWWCHCCRRCCCGGGRCHCCGGASGWGWMNQGTFFLKRGGVGVPGCLPCSSSSPSSSSSCPSLLLLLLWSPRCRWWQWRSWSWSWWWSLWWWLLLGRGGGCGGCGCDVWLRYLVCLVTRPVTWSVWVLVALICIVCYGPIAQRLSAGSIVTAKVERSNPRKDDYFLHQIKYSIGFSGVHLDYWWSPARVLQDWIRSPGIVSILMDSIRSLPGVYLESSRILW